MRTFQFVSGLPGEEVIYEYPGKEDDTGMGVHRAHFLDALVSFLPEGISHFKKKCIGVKEDHNGVTVTFADGTQHTADVVIGCDGIRSTVRTAVLGKQVEAKFMRTVAYRGLIPVENLVEAMGSLILVKPYCIVGPDRHIIAFTLSGQKIANLVMFVSDRSTPVEEQGPKPGESWVLKAATQEEMMGCYDGWGPRVLKLLSFVEKPSKWYLHALDPPLDTFVKGRVALLGDAAHSMLPHLGAGAGQAMEDAYVLSQLLSHPSTSKEDLEVVLKAYDTVRRPRANSVLRGSYAAGEIYELAGPSGGTLEDVKNDLVGLWNFVWHHDLEEDVRQAIHLVEQGRPKNI